jgi:hypothetical protein
MHMGILMKRLIAFGVLLATGLSCKQRIEPGSDTKEIGGGVLLDETSWFGGILGNKFEVLDFRMMLARGGSTVVVNGNIDGKKDCKELSLKQLMTLLDREISIGADSRKFDYRFMVFTFGKVPSSSSEAHNGVAETTRFLTIDKSEHRKIFLNRLSSDSLSTITNTFKMSKFKAADLKGTSLGQAELNALNSAADGDDAIQSAYSDVLYQRWLDGKMASAAWENGVDCVR